MSNKMYPIPDNVQSMSPSGNLKPLNDPPREHFGQEADILGSRTEKLGTGLQTGHEAANGSAKSDERFGIPAYPGDFEYGHKPAISTQNGRAMDSQIGGNHYAKLPIQPGEYAFRNGLNYWQGNVVKYVTRYRDKGGKQDLEKAIDCLRKLIEAEYG